MKKILTMAAVLAASSAVLAGGPATMSAAKSQNGLYVQAQLGYAQTPWKSIIGTEIKDQGVTIISFSYKNGNGGFAWGGDLGYSFGSHYFVEAGGFKLASTTMYIKSVFGNLNQTINTYLLYGALGLQSKLFDDHFTAFGKFGLGFQRMTISKNTISKITKDSSHVGPMFAAGLRYDTDMGLNVSLQWARFAGVQHHDKGEYSTDPNVFTAGLGYWFAM